MKTNINLKIKNCQSSIKLADNMLMLNSLSCSSMFSKYLNYKEFLKVKMKIINLIKIIENTLYQNYFYMLSKADNHIIKISKNNA